MFRITEYERNGRRYRAVFVPWPEVERVLGHPHRGVAEDDEKLVKALLDAGAPWWVRVAEGWVDEHGWGLMGPEIRPPRRNRYRAGIDFIWPERSVASAEYHLDLADAEESLRERGFALVVTRDDMPEYLLRRVQYMLSVGWDPVSCWRKGERCAVVLKFDDE